jgi:hypothetical protein
MLFLNNWRVSVVPYYVTTHPAAIQKQHWHSREAQIEPRLIECEWAFGIRALRLYSKSSLTHTLKECMEVQSEHAFVVSMDNAVLNKSRASSRIV